MNVVRNIFSFRFWRNLIVLLRFYWSGGARVTNPLYVDCKNGSGYLQVMGRKPPKYFAIKMQSGQYGIVRTTGCEDYHDFGGACYSVSFCPTGFYDD